jgi:predicted RecB family nuclease
MRPREVRMRTILTERIFEAWLNCPYKSYLLFKGRRGTRTEYEKHAAHANALYEREALARLSAGKHVTRSSRSTHSLLQGKAELVILKSATADGLRSDAVVLEKSTRNPQALQLVSFHRYDELDAKAKWLLAFRALIVRKALTVALTRARIMSGREFSSKTLHLSDAIGKIEAMLRRLSDLATSKNPPFVLCSHCDICEFQPSCHARAVEEDSLSLLQGMGRARIEEQNRKGIFTLHQYSYTFRTRRLPKRVKKPTKPRYFALQARALRDKKTYFHGNPVLPSPSTSIYYDIEGVPGRRLYYMIGMLVVTQATESYRCFWATNDSDQPRMFEDFSHAVAAHPDATLFHYGNYERLAVQELGRRAGNHYVQTAETIVKSSCNVLGVLHHHCYFPTYSNRLKDVARVLGYHFDNTVLGGSLSIVFRERWEESGDGALKDALIAYNRQDCEALKLISEFVRNNGRPPCNGSPEQDRHVIFADTLRTAGEGKRPAFRKAEFLLPEFAVVNKCAYFDYQRDRVFAKSSRMQKRRAKKQLAYTIRRRSQATLVPGSVRKCPACGSRKLLRQKRLTRWLIDLKYYKTRIGVKKWQPRYVVSRLHCKKCRHTFTSPDLPFVAERRIRYGHGLMCWCIYHNILGKQSLLSVDRGLKDIFNLSIPSGIIYKFKDYLAAYYRELSGTILRTILNRNVIHIDETPVKLRKAIGYIWIISSATEACYLFKESREGAFLDDLLGRYQGVLVSDFFTAYDSLKCPQQKCLIHLMRDMNDDLRRYPYDQELWSVASSFAHLLKQVVLTIERQGLRRRNLHKHAKAAEPI